MSYLFLWTLILAIKIITSVLLPVSADEAYYWVWSKHLSLSYFDHPPMIAYLIKLAEPLGTSYPFFRWPILIMGHAQFLIWYKILKEFFSFEEKQTKAWLILSSCFPILGLGTLIATPDVPLLFFWSLSFYFFLRAISSRHLIDYTFLGVSLGLGFCSKYHIVLFLFCILSYLIFAKKWSTVNPKGVFLAIIVGILTCTPVLYWNYEHDWLSFKFQLTHGLQGKRWKLYWPVSYILGQIALLSPFFLWVYFKNRKSVPVVLSAFVLTPLIFFLFTSFKAHVEMNWTCIVFPAFFAIVVSLPRVKKMIQAMNIFWLSFTLIIGLVTSTSVVESPLKDTVMVQSMLEKLKPYKPLYTGRYQTASLLYYYMNEPVFKLRDMNRFDFYDTLAVKEEQLEKFYFLHDAQQILPERLRQLGYSMTPVDQLGESVLSLVAK